jgi:hypothetical protein
MKSNPMKANPIIKQAHKDIRRQILDFMRMLGLLKRVADATTERKDLVSQKVKFLQNLYRLKDYQEENLRRIRPMREAELQRIEYFASFFKESRKARINNRYAKIEQSVQTLNACLRDVTNKILAIPEELPLYMGIHRDCDAKICQLLSKE